MTYVQAGMTGVLADYIAQLAGYCHGCRLG
jgi:hypothetical protein